MGYMVSKREVLGSTSILLTSRTGENLQEDPIAMLAKYPLMNAYWEDKRAKVELINVPAYVLASMSSGLHTIGSVRGFEDVPHDKKWSVQFELLEQTGERD